MMSDSVFKRYPKFVQIQLKDKLVSISFETRYVCLDSNDMVNFPTQLEQFPNLECLVIRGPWGKTADYQCGVYSRSSTSKALETFVCNGIREYILILFQRTVKQYLRSCVYSGSDLYEFYRLNWSISLLVTCLYASFNVRLRQPSNRSRISKAVLSVVRRIFVWNINTRSPLTTRYVGM